MILINLNITYCIVIRQCLYFSNKENLRQQKRQRISNYVLIESCGKTKRLLGQQRTENGI